MPLPWSGSSGSSFISWPNLVAYYLLFATPFFCAAICVGLAFAAFPNHIARVYRYDMLGAGLGALGVIAALFWLFPSQALRVVGGLGFLAAALASWQEVGVRRWWRTAAYLIGAALVYAAVPTSTASLCPRSEPQQLHRAAATAWCLHRWRGSQPDHRL